MGGEKKHSSVSPRVGTGCRAQESSGKRLGRDNRQGSSSTGRGPGRGDEKERDFCWVLIGDLPFHGRQREVGSQERQKHWGPKLRAATSGSLTGYSPEQKGRRWRWSELQRAPSLQGWKSCPACYSVTLRSH